MVRNDGSGEHIRHETNRKTGKKIRNKTLLKMWELEWEEGLKTRCVIEEEKSV